MMTFLKAILLGLIQGLTEFIPVSSFGNLAVANRFLNYNTEHIALYSILIHLGTLWVLLRIFRNEIKKMFFAVCSMVKDVLENFKIWIENRKNFDARRYQKVLGSNYRRLAFMVLTASIPTAIVGYLLHGPSWEAAGSLLSLGIGFLITGIILLVADMLQAGRKIPRDAGILDVLILGVAQGISVLPGISRTGATISCSVMRGYSRKFSIKYSFLMSIPAVIGAVLAEIGELRGASFDWILVLSGLAGMITAAITGMLCIRAVLRLLQKKNFTRFACCNFVIGILVLAGHFIVGN